MNNSFLAIKDFCIKKWQAIVFSLINIFLFLLPFLWASQKVYKIGGDDSRLYLYAPWEWINHIALYVWYSGFPGGFGMYNPQAFYLPFNLIVAGIKQILPMINHERVVYGLVLAISFSAIYSIIAELIRDKKSWSSFSSKTLGGLAYVFSPMIAGHFWINPPNFFYVIVLYPLLVLFFLQALRQERIVPLIYGALASFALSMSFFNPPLLIPLIIGFGFFLVIYFFLVEANKLRFVKYLFIYSLLILAFNVFFIIPYAHSILSGNSFAKGAFSSDIKNDFVKGGVLNSLAVSQELISHLSGNYTSNGFDWIRGSLGRQFDYIFYTFHLNLLLLIIIVVALLLKARDLEEEKKRLYIISFVILVLAFFQTVNIGDWGQALFGWLVMHIPGFISLRWFFLKTPPSYILFYSVGIGLAFYIVLNSIKKRIILISVLTTVFLIVVAQAMPFISGRVFNTPVSRELNWNVELPRSYLDLVDYLKGLREDNKVITFPLVVGSWTMVQSADPGGVYIGNSPLKALAGKSDFNSFLSFLNPYSTSFFGSVYYLMLNQDYTALEKIFGILNVRYAIYNNGLLEKQGADYDALKGAYLWFWRTRGYEEKYQEMLNNIGKKEKDFGEFQVYKINSRSFLPHIYTSKNLAYFDGDIDRLADILSLPQYAQDSAMFYRGLLPDEEEKKFAIEHSPNFWLMPYHNSEELEEIYRKMRWIYDPATLGLSLAQLENYKKVLDLDRYVLKIQKEGDYQIFLKKNSVLANNINKGLRLCFDNNCFGSINKKMQQNSGRYEMIGQLALSVGEHIIQIKNSKEKISILATGDLILYNFDEKMVVDTPQIEFKQVNPTKYIVKVKKAKESFPLIFNESFHPDWRVYLRDERSAEIVADYRDEEIVGASQNQGLASGKFYETYSLKPIAENDHFLVNTYANAWQIDLNELEKSDRIKKDKDGSYNFELIIEFWPQRVFYFSAAISGSAILFCVIYLVYIGISGKYGVTKKDNLS